MCEIAACISLQMQHDGTEFRMSNKNHPSTAFLSAVQSVMLRAGYMS